MCSSIQGARAVAACAVGAAALAWYLPFCKQGAMPPLYLYVLFCHGAVTASSAAKRELSKWGFDTCGFINFCTFDDTAPASHPDSC